MASERERERSRCRDRVERLSESKLDSDSLRREVITHLQHTIGFDRWCWPLADPETLLPSSGLAEHDFGPAVPRSLELEYSGHDFAAKRVLARRTNSAGSLSAETGGDLARSARWDEVMRRVGIGDVAAVACRDALGCWGWVEAYRDSGDRRFEKPDLDLLANVGPSLGSALRRNAMRTSDGVSVKAGHRERSSSTAIYGRSAGPQGLAPGSKRYPRQSCWPAWGCLPTAVYPAATLARSRATVAGARALLQAVDGRWVMIEAAPLEGERAGEVAVNLRAATATEKFALLCRVYALSQREREVVALLVGALDTRAIAERLFISNHTVQDHLKSVFAKMGIHSRRQLLATLATSSD